MDRFSLISDEYGTWSVVDLETKGPVTVRGKALRELAWDEAGDAAELLNIIHGFDDVSGIDGSIDETIVNPKR